jgi:DNA repair protein SbcD/Mre11
VRFLHTGDWHIGKPLRGRSRQEEFAAALDEVHRIAVAARVDAVLVAGDVFDSPMPPPEAEKLVFDFLARLIPEGIACVVIAGNHDHPKKLGALARLVEGLRIHIRSEVRPPDRGGVVALPSRDGREEARIAVLPFVPERKVVDACQVMAPEHAWFEEYARRIEEILGHLTRGFTPATVNLVLAHLTVHKGLVGTGERALHLGQVYALTPQQLPAGAQYVALGHLHRPQEVLAPSKTRYAGSLIELDFGEREQEKSVVVVEAKPGGAAAVEVVPLTCGRRLCDVGGTLPEILARQAELGDAFLRVRVKVDGPVPGIAEQVKELLPNALDVSLDYAPVRSRGGEDERPRRGLAPAELFADFFRRKNQAEPPAEMLRLFDDVWEEVHAPEGAAVPPLVHS